MKKLWMIVSVVLALVVVFFGYKIWQESTKYTMTQRVFTLQMNTVPEQYASDVLQIATQSVKDKLNAMSFDAAVPVVSTAEGVHTLKVTVPKGITNARMLEAFNQPLEFAIMRQVPKDEADLVLSETDEFGFKNSGITTENIAWVEYGTAEDGKGAMRIVLDEAGQAALQEVYTTYDGAEIGIIIRKRLVAKLLVKSDDFDKDIRIFGIPDLSIAQLVADDMIVGRYITFTQ